MPISLVYAIIMSYVVSLTMFLYRVAFSKVSRKDKYMYLYMFRMILIPFLNVENMAQIDGDFFSKVEIKIDEKERDHAKYLKDRFSSKTSRIMKFVNNGNVYKDEEQ